MVFSESSCLVAKVRQLCAELGILVAPFDRIWRRMGIAPLEESPALPG